MAGPRPHPGPPPTPLAPHTHIKGLTKVIVGAKDGVGDGDQRGAGPFLPRGEVVVSNIFHLRGAESSEGP